MDLCCELIFVVSHVDLAVILPITDKGFGENSSGLSG